MQALRSHAIDVPREPASPRAAALVQAERDRDTFARPKCALAAWQVKRLTAFVDANLGGNIATEDLTELVQMSTGHFFRSFKRCFGETPFSFIARRRMLRAQELMLINRRTAVSDRARVRPLRSTALHANVSAHLRRDSEGAVSRWRNRDDGIWRFL
jgi:AraC-like DNA-binding protein